MLTREEIAKRLNAGDYTERGLSEQLGFSPVTIRLLRHNKGEPRRRTLIQMSAFLEAEAEKSKNGD